MKKKINKNKLPHKGHKSKKGLRLDQKKISKEKHEIDYQKRKLRKVKKMTGYEEKSADKVDREDLDDEDSFDDKEDETEEEDLVVALALMFGG